MCLWQTTIIKKKMKNAEQKAKQRYTKQGETKNIEKPICDWQ